MDLERVAAAIRPRPYLEAVDLGFHMVRAWWRPIYGASTAVVAGLTALAALAFHDLPWVALLLVWWSKPVWDRPVLHVASRALFGTLPTLGETLLALARGPRRGWIAELTLRRLDPERSLKLPVRQLEGLRGRVLDERLRVLVRGLGEQGVGLTLTCVLLEVSLVIATSIFLMLMIPGSMREGWLAPEWPFYPLALQWALALIGIAALVAIEPFYVAAGFCLYLNRRTLLEAWDIEVAFRRMSRRLAAEGGRTLSGAGPAVLCLALMLGATPARAADTEAKQLIEEILAAPEFGGERVEEHWRWRPVSSPWQMDSNLGGAFLAAARVIERALWVAAGLVLLGLLCYIGLRRAARRERSRQGGGGEPPPRKVFGMPIAEAALVEDAAAAARALGDRGDLLGAIRLLYREAVARLIFRHRLAIHDGSTEGDCLRLARGRIPADACGYLSELTRAWQIGTYGHRIPSTETVERLIRDWAARFAGASR